MRTPEGTSLAATQIAAERIAREVRAWPEVQTTLLTIGDNQQKTPNLASIFVRLVPPDAAHASPGRAAEPGAQARSCPSCPRSYRISVSVVAAFGAASFSTATVQYVLTGPDLEQLAQYSDQIVAEAEERSRAPSTSTRRS